MREDIVETEEQRRLREEIHEKSGKMLRLLDELIQHPEKLFKPMSQPTQPKRFLIPMRRSKTEPDADL